MREAELADNRPGCSPRRAPKRSAEDRGGVCGPDACFGFSRPGSGVARQGESARSSISARHRLLELTRAPTNTRPRERRSYPDVGLLLRVLGRPEQKPVGCGPTGDDAEAMVDVVADVAGAWGEVVRRGGPRAMLRVVHCAHRYSARMVPACRGKAGGQSFGAERVRRRCGGESEARSSKPCAGFACRGRLRAGGGCVVAAVGRSDLYRGQAFSGRATASSGGVGTGSPRVFVARSASTAAASMAMLQASRARWNPEVSAS
jgi:hypothetical protein